MPRPFDNRPNLGAIVRMSDVTNLPPDAKPDPAPVPFQLGVDSFVETSFSGAPQRGQ